jgi:hypothetical protein
LEVEEVSLVVTLANLGKAVGAENILLVKDLELPSLVVFL